MIGVIFSNAGKEIIKGTHTRDIPEVEATEDGIKGSFPEHPTPNRDGSHLQFQGKQVRMEHTGRKAWLRTKNRVRFQHNESVRARSRYQNCTI